MHPKSFYALGLSMPLVRVLEGLRITEPTDIEHKTIPQALAGRDVLASAETGVTPVNPEEEAALALIERSTGRQIPRATRRGFSDGRSDHQVRRAMEVGRLRGSSTRSFRPRRASR